MEDKHLEEEEQTTYTDDEDEDTVSIVSEESKSDQKRKTTTPNRKRIAKDEELKMLQKATTLLESFKKPKADSTVAKEDEYDTFAKHIANELRLIKRPEMLRMAKYKINNIIFEAQSDQPPVTTSAVETSRHINANQQQPFWETYRNYLGPESENVDSQCSQNFYSM